MIRLCRVLLVELSSSQTNKSFYTEKQGAPTRTHPAKSHRQQRYVQQGVPRRERSVFLCWGCDGPVPPATRQARVCAAQRSNESPSGAFKRLNGLAQQDGGASPRQVPVCRTAPNSGKAPAFQNGCRGFLFVYFKMISPFSPASTTRVPPDASVPSIRRSAAGSSTALRITRRKSRAPNLPP